MPILIAAVGWAGQAFGTWQMNAAKFLPRAHMRRISTVWVSARRDDWIIRRPGSLPKELVLEIMEQKSDGSRVERRLVLEKQ